MTRDEGNAVDGRFSATCYRLMATGDEPASTARRLFGFAIGPVIAPIPRSPPPGRDQNCDAALQGQV